MYDMSRERVHFLISFSNIMGTRKEILYKSDAKRTEIQEILNRHNENGCKIKYPGIYCGITEGKTAKGYVQAKLTVCGDYSGLIREVKEAKCEVIQL